MSPKPDVSEERTAQIITAAMTVFARQGFDKARMDDIATESGLSKGTLYLYFKSKDAIISIILKALLSRELVQARKIIEVSGSAAEKLNEIVDIVLHDFKSMQPLMSIYFEFLAQAVRKNSVKQVIQQYFREFLELMTALIAQGVETGEFDTEHPEDCALAIAAAIEGMVLMWVYDPEKVDLEKHIQSAVGLIVQGIEAKDEK